MRRLLNFVAVAGAAMVLAGCGVLAKDIPYATLEAKYANSASRYMDLPSGLHVHYRDQGKKDGPPVVLVHGFSASLHAWEPWVARLGTNYRIITLDMPGHGLTRAPKDYASSIPGNVEVIDEVTRKLGVDKFVIGGNSMGGGISWNYALAHQDRLNGLILVDAAGWPRETKGKEKPPLAFVLLANPLGRALLRNINPAPLAKPGLESAYVDKSLVTPELIQRYVDLALAPGHRAMLTGGRAAPRVRSTSQSLPRSRSPP